MSEVCRPVRLRAALLGVVCRKCVRRAGGDPGKAAKRLGSALREAAGTRRVQAADVGCLGLCPKGWVVVVPAGGTPHVVPAKGWRRHAARLLAASHAAGGA